MAGVVLISISGRSFSNGSAVWRVLAESLEHTASKVSVFEALAEELCLCPARFVQGSVVVALSQVKRVAVGFAMPHE